MLWGSRANPRGDRHDAQIDHGYAATIHKAQGVTVDRTHVLATPGMGSHSAYVALSRHRDRVDLHYGQDDFADQGRLVRKLSRERAKDMASDYAREPKRQFASGVGSRSVSASPSWRIRYPRRCRACSTGCGFLSNDLSSRSNQPRKRLARCGEPYRQMRTFARPPSCRRRYSICRLHNRCMGYRPMIRQ